MLRSAFIFLVLLVLTPVLCLIIVLSNLMGVEHKSGSIYEKCAKLWVTVIIRLSGVEVVLHGKKEIETGETRIYASNHVSWFDVFTLAQVVPHYTFIAKSELKKIPVFGLAASSWGVIWIERENRKKAFESYRVATEIIKEGKSVVVCPEGTRGHVYPLRKFKKGPFVLAIASGAPVVPTLVYGTIAVQPKNKYTVKPGRVDIHFLEPIPTAGLTYEDRDELAEQCRDVIAAEMERVYGIKSPQLRDSEAVET